MYFKFKLVFYFKSDEKLSVMSYLYVYYIMLWLFSHFSDRIELKPLISKIYS